MWGRGRRSIAWCKWAGIRRGSFHRWLVKGLRLVSDEVTADSSAALRNDNKKNRQRQVQVQKQIPSLPCGMTTKEQATASASTEADSSASLRNDKQRAGKEA